MQVVVRTFSRHSPEYGKALALRFEVLRKPLGLEFTEEELRKDVEDTHLGLFDEEKMVACLILSKTDNGRIKMRQVAVDANHQRTGLGTVLSQAAEKFSRDSGFKVIYCHARKSAVPFYEKLGYKAVGAEFTEVNIPHLAMEKQL